MNCLACGADNRDGANFCRMCGQGLVTPAPGQEPGAQPGGQPEPPALALEPTPSGPPPEERVPEAAEGPVTPGEPAPTLPGAGAPHEQPAEPAEPEPGPVAETDLEVSGGEAPPQRVEPAPGTGAASVDAAQAQEPDQTAGAELPGAEESPPLTPATAGTLIAGRYLVVEALDTQPDQVLYRVQDLQQCRQCGFSANAVGELFCAQCGASLDLKPEARLIELREGLAEPPDAVQDAVRLAEEGRLIFLESGPQAEPSAEPRRQGMRLLVGQRSDTGRVRELDEDSLLVLNLAASYEATTGPVLGLFAVADGMGGHEGGEVASRMALQVVAERVLRTLVLPEIAGQPAPEEAVLTHLGEAAIAANDAVFLARQKRKSDMGTTLTMVLIRDDRLFLAHTGDCRAYRWNARGLKQLTSDHSLVAKMVASGQIAPEELYTHPHRSIIYRCIGDQPEVEVDTESLSVAAGDRIVLCSDGLWEMVRNQGIEDVLLQESDPQAACDRLVDHANMAGGEDNISVIVVQVEAMGQGGRAEAQPSLAGTADA